MFKTRLLFETIRTLAGASVLTASYTKIGTPTLYPTRALDILNETDVAIYISLDGINNHLYLPIGGPASYPLTAQQTFVQGAFLPANTQYYAKAIGANGAMGNIYLTVLASAF